MFCGCCLNCALAWENKLVVKEAEEVLLGAAYVLKVLKWLFIHILKGYKLNYVTHVMWVVKCEIMCCLIWNQYFDHIQVNHSILVVNNGLLFLCPINPWVWLNKLSVKLAQFAVGSSAWVRNDPLWLLSFQEEHDRTLRILMRGTQT